jgi:replicative DNA helicase
VSTSAPPPQNIDAEKAVLGAMMLSEQALRAGRVAGLRAQHFYMPRHQEIYATLERVVKREGYTDELMLANEAPAHRVYIAELAAGVPAAGNAKHYAEIVIQNANLRQKLEGSYKIAEGVRVAQEKGDDAEEESEQLIREGQALVATDLTIEAEPTSRQELGDDFYTYLESDEEEDIFELPFPDLNECVLGGYRRKQTTVLAGWTGMGKSWFLDQMLRGFRKQGYSTAIFATEMSRRERVARHITQTTGIATEKLLRKTLTKDELSKAVKALGEIPFDYYEAIGWTEGEIAERVIFGGYDVVAIDVVNLIPGYEEEVAKANRIAQRFMQLATQANCHVILVSHLNRERDKQVVKPRPVKRDLRQTGMLEANANAILFLHRDQNPEDGTKEPGGEAFFDKVRNGMEGSVRLTLNQRFLNFHSEARVPPGTDAAGPFLTEPPERDLFAGEGR